MFFSGLRLKWGVMISEIIIIFFCHKSHSPLPYSSGYNHESKIFVLTTAHFASNTGFNG